MTVFTAPKKSIGTQGKGSVCAATPRPFPPLPTRSGRPTEWLSSSSTAQLTPDTPRKRSRRASHCGFMRRTWRLPCWQRSQASLRAWRGAAVAMKDMGSRHVHTYRCSRQNRQWPPVLRCIRRRKTAGGRSGSERPPVPSRVHAAFLWRGISSVSKYHYLCI